MSVDEILMDFINISEISELKKIIYLKKTDIMTKYINHMIQQRLIEFIKININNTYNCNIKEKVSIFRSILNHIVLILQEMIDKIRNQHHGFIYETKYSKIYISNRDLYIINWFIFNINSIRLHYGY